MAVFSSKGLFAVVALATALACSERLVVGTPGGEPDAGSSHASNFQSNAAPVFNGATIQAPTAPRPISGGTLITVTTSSGTLAVASDPDEDAVDMVALGDTPHFFGQVLLQPGDDPGRLVADAAGRVHVVLRGGGAVATIYPTGPSLLQRRSVCSAPRGIDYAASQDAIVVVCATGEVMMLPAGGGEATLDVMVDRDLRDVVVDGDTMLVTRLRSAEVLTLNMSGHVTKRMSPAVPPGSSPDVAWRAVRDPIGGIRILHQIASTETVVVDAAPPPTSPDPPPAPYGGGATNTVNNQPMPPIVISAVSSINAFNGTPAMPLATNPAVDLAVTKDGMFEVLGLLGTIEIGDQTNGTTNQLSAFASNNAPVSLTSPDEFVAIADARETSGVLVVQRRAAIPALVVIPTTQKTSHGLPPVPDTLTESFAVLLPQRTPHVDTGFDVFHVPTAAGIACMNCHPEGGDDGHTWTFKIKSKMRVRRTQSLRGGVILDTAPYHWDGDMPSLQALCNEIFTHRMGGGSVLPEQATLLARFLNGIPRVPVSAKLDPNAVAKGRVIFDGNGGCVGCHAGPLGTSPYNQDVGKTDSLKASPTMQVPMLIDVADRAPYMHDGCAATLMDRLTNPACAGTKHGNTAQLTPEERSDLVQLLESL